MRTSIRLTREIFAQSALAPYRGEELAPGARLQTDEELDLFIRETAVTGSHPTGTCRMGRVDDPLAVVDSSGRVIGLEQLRVVDSSIMPFIITGNLNAGTMMLAEKLADSIRQREPLPKSNAPYFVHPEWELRQR